MDEKSPREGNVEPRGWLAADDDLNEKGARGKWDDVHDEQSRRRLPGALTERERTERWPCG